MKIWIAVLIHCLIIPAGGILLRTVHAKNNVLISSGNHNYPPSSWQEGDQIVGLAADLVTLIFKDFGIPVQSAYKGPWKRVQDAAQKGDIDVLTTLYKNPERETYLDFPDEPYMVDSVVIWVKKGATFPFNTWDDLIGKIGGIAIGDSLGGKFDAFMEQLTIEKVANLKQNFKKLIAGHIDYLPCGLYTGMIATKRLGIDENVEYLPTPLLSEGLYLAISKKSIYRTYLPAVEEAIRKYKADGTIEQLIQENMVRYMRKQHGPQ